MRDPSSDKLPACRREWPYSMHLMAIQPYPRIAEIVSQIRDQRHEQPDNSGPAAKTLESNSAEEIQPGNLSMGETVASRAGIVPMIFVSSELIGDDRRFESSKEGNGGDTHPYAVNDSERMCTPPGDPDSTSF